MFFRTKRRIVQVIIHTQFQPVRTDTKAAGRPTRETRVSRAIPTQLIQIRFSYRCLSCGLARHLGTDAIRTVVARSREGGPEGTQPGPRGRSSNAFCKEFVSGLQGPVDREYELAP
jgi:hypothetical protein